MIPCIQGGSKGPQSHSILYLPYWIGSYFCIPFAQTSIYWCNDFIHPIFISPNGVIAIRFLISFSPLLIPVTPPPKKNSCNLLVLWYISHNVADELSAPVKKVDCNSEKVDCNNEKVDCNYKKSTVTISKVLYNFTGADSYSQLLTITVNFFTVTVNFFTVTVDFFTVTVNFFESSSATLCEMYHNTNKWLGFICHIMWNVSQYW